MNASYPRTAPSPGILLYLCSVNTKKEKREQNNSEHVYWTKYSTVLEYWFTVVVNLFVEFSNQSILINLSIIFGRFVLPLPPIREAKSV